MWLALWAVAGLSFVAGWVCGKKFNWQEGKDSS